MEAIYNFDLKILNFISSNMWNGWLDDIMKVITRLGDYGILWIVIAGILFLNKKYRKCSITIIVGLLCSVILSNLILKELVARPRPFDYEAWKSFFVYPEIIDRPKDLSFPSGHTTAAIASSFILLMKNKKFGIPAFVMALLIAFSRVYLYVHYPTDVLTGIVLGAIYGIIAILIVDKLIPLLKRWFRLMKLKIKRKIRIANKKRIH